MTQGNRDYGHPESRGHYNGKYLWNLNPRFGLEGHFHIPTEILENREEVLRAKIDVTLTDIYKHEHPLLPVGCIHRLGKKDDWYFEASVEELTIRRVAY